MQTVLSLIPRYFSRLLPGILLAAMLPAAPVAANDGQPHPSVTLTASPLGAQLVGVPVTLTAAGAGGTGSYEYEFWLKSKNTAGLFVRVQNYSADPTYVLSGLDMLGRNTIRVHIRNQGSAAEYQNRATRSIKFRKLRVVVTSNLPVKVGVGSLVTLTADVPDGLGTYEYRYTLRGPTTGNVETDVRGFSVNPNWDFDTTGAIGKHKITVYARAQGSTVANEGRGRARVKVTKLKVAVTSNPPSPQITETPVTFTASVLNGNGTYEYEFWLNGFATGKVWTLVRGYSVDPNWTWDTTGIIGKHSIRVNARNVGSAAAEEGTKTIKFKVKPFPPPVLGPIIVNAAAPLASGEIPSVNFTAQATGGKGVYEFQFELKGGSTGGAWAVTQSYSAGNSWTWDTLDLFGTHAVRVRVRNEGSPKVYQAQRTTSYQLAGRVIFSSNFDWTFTRFSDASAQGWSYEMVKNNGRSAGGAQIGTTTDQTFSGARSLQCDVPNLDPSTVSREGATQKSMLAYTGHRYPRGDTLTLIAQFYVPSSSSGRVTIYDIEDNKNNNRGVRFQLEDGNVVMNRDKLGIRPYTIRRSVNIPRNRWFEARVELVPGGGTNGHVRMWIDGNKVMDEATATIAAGMQSYTTVQAGITARLNTRYRLYMDNFQIAVGGPAAGSSSTMETATETTTSESELSAATATTDMIALDTAATVEADTSETTDLDSQTTTSAGTGAAVAYYTLDDAAVMPHPSLGVALRGVDAASSGLAAAGGMGVARLDVDWSAVEPVAGQYDWASLDAAVAALQDHDVKPLLTLYSDVAWATRAETADAKNRAPADMATWAAFVGAVVERYDGDGLQDAPSLVDGVQLYQVANEWLYTAHERGGWAASTDDLVAYINAAHDAVKAAHPSATFVLGGIASWNLDALVLHEGLATYTARDVLADGTAISLTAAQAQDPAYADMAAEAYRVLGEARYDFADVHLYGPVNHDAYKMYLVTEHTGMRPVLSTEGGGPSLAYEDYTPAAHFLAVVDRNLTALDAGMPFMQWAGMTADESAGANAMVPLLDSHGDATAGYRAYQFLALVLEDMESVEQLAPGRFLVHRVGGGDLVIAWRTEGADTLTLPSTYASADVLRMQDAAGALYTVEDFTGGNLSLGALPAVVGDLPPGL